MDFSDLPLADAGIACKHPINRSDVSLVKERK